ncbi:MAG: hypothetical protein K2Y04_12230 [Caulobacteraceae bacterium]|nr:hypothetical protein [Caulobacteraceae bacterium]
MIGFRSGLGAKALASVVLVAGSLSGCSTYTVIENAYADTVTGITGPLPESQRLEPLPLSDLVCCAPAGLKQFEIARRYEEGVGGLSRRVDCAVHWYGVAGRTRTTVTQRDTYLGTTGPVTYLGLPQARAALRRLQTSSNVNESRAAPEGCDPARASNSR